MSRLGTLLLHDAAHDIDGGVVTLEQGSGDDKPGPNLLESVAFYSRRIHRCSSIGRDIEVNSIATWRTDGAEAADVISEPRRPHPLAMSA